MEDKEIFFKRMRKMYSLSPNQIESISDDE